MKPEELKKILELHSAFVKSSGEKGKRANLRYADLEGANLRGENLRGANLWGSNLWGADLRYATLEGASLWGSNLRGANLRGANLWGADLEGASLQGANLEGANLEGVDLRYAIGNGCEIKSINAFFYPIAYTSTHMFIGCEGHAIEDWENFTLDEIHEMDGDGATLFWGKWKEFILEFISKNPATPVTTENKK